MWLIIWPRVFLYCILAENIHRGYAYQKKNNMQHLLTSCSRSFSIKCKVFWDGSFAIRKVNSERGLKMCCLGRI